MSPIDTFVEAVRNEQPDVVALSGFLTLSYDAMRDTVAALNAAGLRDHIKIMIGGAPVSQDVADKYGADGYAKDATNALKDAINMIGSLKQMKDEAEAKKAK